MILPSAPGNHHHHVAPVDVQTHVARHLQRRPGGFEDAERAGRRRWQRGRRQQRARREPDQPPLPAVLFGIPHAAVRGRQMAGNRSTLTQGPRLVRAGPRPEKLCVAARLAMRLRASHTQASQRDSCGVPRGRSAHLADDLPGTSLRGDIPMDPSRALPTRQRVILAGWDQGC